MAFSVAALIRKRGFLVMAGLRRAIEWAIGEEELAALRAIARSRTEPSSRVERADAVGLPGRPLVLCGESRFGVHQQRVQRCVERALAYGAMAALDDLPMAGQGADGHRRGQGMAGVSRLPQGEGPGLSPRIVDDAASGSPRARARTRRRTRLPRQAGSRHAVQDPQ